MNYRVECATMEYKSRTGKVRTVKQGHVIDDKAPRTSFDWLIAAGLVTEITPTAPAAKRTNKNEAGE